MHKTEVSKNLPSLNRVAGVGSAHLSHNDFTAKSTYGMIKEFLYTDKGGLAVDLEVEIELLNRLMILLL